VLSSQISQETVGDLEPAGIPGTPSNTPNSQGNAAAVAQAKAGNTTQGIHSESKTYAVSRTTRHLLEPAGRVRRIAAALLVDDVIESNAVNGKTQETRRKRTPEEMKQLEELAKAAIGYDSQRGDLFSIQNISFRQTPVDLPTPPGKIQRVMTFAERWTGVLRYAALFVLFALVYLLLLRPVKKQLVLMLQGSKQQALATGAGAPGLPAGAIPAGSAVAAIAAESMTDVPAEVQHSVTLKKQLVKKVKEDPEAASRLIQNWMRVENEHQ